MLYEQSCIFAEFPLDPCDEIRGDFEQLKTLLKDHTTRFLIYYEGNALMDRQDLCKPLYIENQDYDRNFIFLGKDGSQAYFAVETSQPEEFEKGQFVDMRTIARETAARGFSPIPSLIARGKMLLDWHSRHQYCSNCGKESEIRRGGYVRHCKACDSDHFPRVDPVVIMMVIYEDKCLLGRSPAFLPGMFSALAGFVEPGETIEEAVRREVLEEAGIKVGEVEYIKSQPWPFPSSLMIGVVAEALSSEINIDNDELEDAQWFSKEDIVSVLEKGGDDDFRVPDKLAIARHLLEHQLMVNWAND